MLPIRRIPGKSDNDGGNYTLKPASAAVDDMFYNGAQASQEPRKGGLASVIDHQSVIIGSPDALKNTCDERAKYAVAIYDYFPFSLNERHHAGEAGREFEKVEPLGTGCCKKLKSNSRACTILHKISHNDTMSEEKFASERKPQNLYSPRPHLVRSMALDEVFSMMNDSQNDKS